MVKCFQKFHSHFVPKSISQNSNGDLSQSKFKSYNVSLSLCSSIALMSSGPSRIDSSVGIGVK